MLLSVTNFSISLKRSTYLLDLISFIAFSALDTVDYVLCFIFIALDWLWGQHGDGCYCHFSRDVPYVESKTSKIELEQHGRVSGSVVPALGAGDEQKQYATPLAVFHALAGDHEPPQESVDARALEESKRAFLALTYWHSSSSTINRRHKVWLWNLHRLSRHPSSWSGAEDIVHQRSTVVNAGQARSSLVSRDVEGPSPSGSRGQAGSKLSSRLPAGNASAEEVVAHGSRAGTRRMSERSRGRTRNARGRGGVSKTSWSDCKCAECIAWEGGDGHLHVFVGAWVPHHPALPSLSPLPHVAAVLPLHQTAETAGPAPAPPSAAAAAVAGIADFHESAGLQPRGGEAGAEAQLEAVAGAIVVAVAQAQAHQAVAEAVAVAAAQAQAEADAQAVAVAKAEAEAQAPAASVAEAPAPAAAVEEAEAQAEGGADVIFIHGFVSSSTFWSDKLTAQLQQQLQQRRRSSEGAAPSAGPAAGSAPVGRLFAPDLLGFGRSPKPRDCAYTVGDHVSWLERSVLQRHGVKRYHVVGHSLGCIVGVALAARHPEAVCSVTLLSPPYALPRQGMAADEAFFLHAAPRRAWPPLALGIAIMSWHEHIGRAFCSLLCRGHPVWEAAAPLLLSLLALSDRVPVAFIKAFTQHTHHSAWHIFHNTLCGGAHLFDPALDLLEAHRVSIKVMHGRQDAICPYDLALEMARRHPSVTLQGVAGADHVSILIGREDKLAKDLCDVFMG
eukprot:jgi/Mesen1/10432/ME000082S09938